MSVTLLNQFNPSDTLTFDAIEFARFDHVIDVTEHPIEDGQDVSDHAQVRALPMTVRGIIAVTPIGIAPAVTPRETAIAWFERNQGKLITAIFPVRGTFVNVLITRWPHDVDRLEQLVFDVGLKQVRLASPTAVLIPPRVPKADVQTGTGSEQDTGGQATEAVGSPAPASVLGTAALAAAAFF